MFETFSDKGAITIRVVGNLDVESAPDLREAVRVACDDDCTSLYVDLTDCAYVDSTAISVFVRLWKRSRVPFHVGVSRSGCVHKILEISGFLSQETFVRVIPAHLKLVS